MATKVVRFSPSRTAAPWGPPTTQRVARNACKIKARWESKYVLGAGGTVTGFVSDSGKGFPSTPSSDRITARSIKF